MNDVSGIDPGRTPVMFNGVQVGLVKSIDMGKDYSSATADLAMDPRVEDMLLEGTEFWTVKPSISLAGITGLEALVKGNYIDVRFAKSGAPSREFTIRPKAPPLNTDAPGLHLVLTSDKLGSIDIGAPILYRQVRVGSVQSYQLSRDRQRVVVCAHRAGVRAPGEYLDALLELQRDHPDRQPQWRAGEERVATDPDHRRDFLRHPRSEGADRDQGAALHPLRQRGGGDGPWRGNPAEHRQCRRPARRHADPLQGPGHRQDRKRRAEPGSLRGTDEGPPDFRRRARRPQRNPLLGGASGARPAAYREPRNPGQRPLHRGAAVEHAGRAPGTLPDSPKRPTCWAGKAACG